jgi:integrase/recombinase XerD
MAENDENDDREETLSAVEAEIASELEDELGEIALHSPMRRLPAVPSVREVRTLLDCAREEPRDYLVLRLLYYTGTRVSELAAICFADVSQEDATVFIRGGKGDQDRYVCIEPTSLELIDTWRAGRSLAERIVDVQPRQINRIADEYGKRAGLVQKYEAMARSWSPHSLRHAFATHRYDAGMDLAVLKKLLGHRFLATTLIYVQTSMRHAQKQYRKTDPLAR